MRESSVLLGSGKTKDLNTEKKTTPSSARIFCILGNHTFVILKMNLFI